jgi:hypothetical protein
MSAAQATSRSAPVSGTYESPQDQEMREGFQRRFQEYMASISKKNATIMTKERYDRVMECVEAHQSGDEGRIKRAKDLCNTRATFHDAVRQYDVAIIGHNKILYRKNPSAERKPANVAINSQLVMTKLVRFCYEEEVYDLVRTAHLVDTFHAGSRSTHQELCKTIANIPQDVVELYVRHCPCKCGGWKDEKRQLLELREEQADNQEDKRVQLEAIANWFLNPNHGGLLLNNLNISSVERTYPTAEAYVSAKPNILAAFRGVLVENESSILDVVDRNHSRSAGDDPELRDARKAANK